MLSRRRQRRAIVSKKRSRNNENYEVEDAKSKIASKVASMDDLADSPLLGKKVVFKRNGIIKKRKHSEDSGSASSASVKTAPENTNNLKYKSFERQENRSPKRRKKDFDVVFDTRGMCMVQ